MIRKEIIKNIFIKVWEFIRGDITIQEFEDLAYNNDSIIKYFTKELYLEIISNDFKNKDSIYKLKEKLKSFQIENHPTNCKCIELSNLAVVDMGEESDLVFNTFQKIVDRGEPYWWIYLCVCKKCNQHWLIAQEERHNDIFCLFRLDIDAAEQIINNGNWPTIFDRYENLLNIGKDSGKSVRFFEPENSLSLHATMEDIAKENPGIKLSYLAELLNIDIETALIIGKTLVKNNGVNIKLDE